MAAWKFTDQSYNNVIVEDEMKVICLPKLWAITSKLLTSTFKIVQKLH